MAALHPLPHPKSLQHLLRIRLLRSHVYSIDYGIYLLKEEQMLNARCSEFHGKNQGYITGGGSQLLKKPYNYYTSILAPGLGPGVYAV